MALILRRRGIERVRPLAGGFYAWRDRGFPVAALPGGMSPAAGRTAPPAVTVITPR